VWIGAFPREHAGYSGVHPPFGPSQAVLHVAARPDAALEGCRARRHPGPQRSRIRILLRGHRQDDQTICPTILRSVPGDRFRSFLAKHGEASLLAAQLLSEAYRVAFTDVRRLALSESSAARLAGVLLEWGTAESIGKPEMRLTMALTHEELANLVGCARETVTRLLGQFRRQKLIAVHGISILIQCPEKLERIAA